VLRNSYRPLFASQLTCHFAAEPLNELLILRRDEQPTDASCRQASRRLSAINSSRHPCLPPQKPLPLFQYATAGSPCHSAFPGSEAARGVPIANAGRYDSRRPQDRPELWARHLLPQLISKSERGLLRLMPTDSIYLSASLHCVS